MASVSGKACRRCAAPANSRKYSLFLPASAPHLPSPEPDWATIRPMAEQHDHDHDHGEHAHGHDHEHSHDHAHGHGHAHVHGAVGGTAMYIAVALTLGFAAVEAVAGLISGSLALVSDAGHMVTDAVALGIAAFAAW